MSIGLGLITGSIALVVFGIEKFLAHIESRDALHFNVA